MYNFANYIDLNNKIVYNLEYWFYTYPSMRINIA